ncbi:hypothetical protein KC19_4G091000 [Ceratodon purpureus]|uniref:Ubiquitin-like protease family profile domain-containing protein n=1 Tax=Ceratodon purpureus TaxID=3225 RepID=A0A8T0I8N9_CERPU|nr:hypothetical protein KC19_4G091000 [Ceratodon purpureus]
MADSGFPTLDLMIEPGSGNYLLDHHAMAISEGVASLNEAPALYQIALRQNPQGEVDMPQAYGSSLPWSDASRAPDLTSTLHTQPDGAMHEGDERVQSVHGVEFNVGTWEDNASRHEYHQDTGETSLDNDRQCELLTFPEGEDDAVTITVSDMEGLQPMRFLSNNIIDFYIKFLEARLSSEDRERFYFFNSFFFTKLLGNSSSFADIYECGVDYNGVRNWTGEVNLFEKDYIFIPILRSSHWSLIIICHLSGLTSSPDKNRGSPCVFHLDSFEGIHESFESQIRSYTFQACMERYRDSNDKEQTILALVSQMKYVRAKVQRQRNDYDCGLYLLHYVEVFLRESNSPHFSFHSSIAGPHFTSPYFAEDVSAKRQHIHDLIGKLTTHPQSRTVRPITDIPRKPQRRPPNEHCPNSQPNKPSPKPPKVQQKLSKKWNAKETSLLLNRMVAGGRIRKGTEGATHWDRISQDIQTELRTIRTEDECRRRYDTLLKAYKKIKKIGKPFCDVSDQERVGLSLATPLTEEWYTAIDTICLQRGSDNGKSCKRAKLNLNDENGMVSLSPRNPPPPPIPPGCPEPGKPSRKQVVAIPGFSTLDEVLRSTLLSLIQVLTLKVWYFETTCKLEEACRMLAIVQDREPCEIRGNIFKLSELKLVNLEYDNDEGVDCLQLSDLRVYKKFVKKVVGKNPDFDIFREMYGNCDSVALREAPLSGSLLRIRVLSLRRCSKLEHADLSHFPELRYLSIQWCGKLQAVSGWEVVQKLGWLKIRYCRSYVDFPPVQCLPSLREFSVVSSTTWLSHMIPVLDFSQCVRLRSLEIFYYKSWALNSMDLSSLRFLEVLTLWSCSGLTTIQGLSGLQHSLTKLKLVGCSALRRVPELGWLKALTHLDMSLSGVEEIPGLQDLHLLTKLNFWGCESLKALPHLGHLKALTYLGIGGTAIEEILGVEELLSLESLQCDGSKLKRLPDLHHLPRLREVRIDGTPLKEIDPSLFLAKYFVTESNW